MTPPSKEQLQRELLDVVAVLRETRDRATGERLDVPEHERARERCCAVIATGARLGYWPPLGAGEDR